MNKYQINVSVTSAEGWQLFEVEADSEQEARAKFNAGEGEFIEQELEVMDIEIDSIVEVEGGRR